jgi:hypothetical protein
MRHSKKKLKRRTNKRKTFKGGLLIMNPTTDLVNTHLCNNKPSKLKETPGDEIYSYNGSIVQLNLDTVGFVKQLFKKSEDKWFKFIIFNNDNNYYIYLINGGKVNKHSVCMLIGLLDVTLEKNEYNEIREAVKNIELFKLRHSPERVFSTPELHDELKELKRVLDDLVNRDIRCMPVVSAGSGTVNDDNSICINNKSGHYKPTAESMEVAKRIFEEKTGLDIIVTEKVDKEILKAKYGEHYESYTGMCV